MAKSPEAFISVDVEAAGPFPGRYSLLSIGACLVGDPEQGFYVELQPVNDEALAGAMRIHRLSIENLKRTGLPPIEAMQRFADWIRQVTPAGAAPVMVGFNAGFDWSFVNDYFLRFIGENPFGHAPVDVKSFYMGLTGCDWSATSKSHLPGRYLGGRDLTHNALADARMQGEAFRRMLAEARHDLNGNGGKDER